MSTLIRIAVFITLVVGCEIASAQNPLRSENRGQFSRQKIEPVPRFDVASNANSIRHPVSYTHLTLPTKA